MNMTATPLAADELKKAVDARAEAPKDVRVMVQSFCGCGSAHYAMGFDDPQQDDTRIDINGVTVLVDPDSAEYLDNAALDFVTGHLGQGGFAIHSANGGGCGCGGGHHH
ncbi:MAG TPA: iron-sulfur cluster assembly accessory protein [Chloroflexota bacterium]|nr:iron-sulfur cluster assembly accessory protein [Chloroflexota bacterium]